MHGAEYDELVGELEAYKDKFEKVVVAEPLLGEVGADATEINADKKAVAEDITAEAVKTAGYDSLMMQKKIVLHLYLWAMVHPIQQRSATARCLHRCSSLDMTTYLLEL